METVIHFGDTLKALDDKGKVGGYLVRFGSPTQKDASGDYFTAETYYGPFDGNNQEALFHHGQPVLKGLEHLADHTFNPIVTRRDDIGIWAETVLNMADEYESKVYEMVKRGKLGWSSGSSPHRVKKLKDGKIVSWPICEGSLTPEPCEPLNRGGIMPLKSLAALTVKSMGTTGAGASLVPNPASPKKEIRMSRNTKADEVCENPDCDNYGESHENCQCHKTVKGDGSETDYEVSEEENETYPGATGSEKADLVASGGDYALYEANREEVGVTAKTDYALYEANREEVGVTTGDDDSKKDGDHTFGIDAGLVHGHIGLASMKDGDGELFGHNIGPARVSIGLAKSLQETVKYLAAVAAVPGIGETLKAGHKYHIGQLRAAVKTLTTKAAPVAKKPQDDDADLEAELAKLTPAQKAWAEKELAEIERLRNARKARQQTLSNHEARKQRAAAQRRR
jgi:hypothetical protein